MSIWQSIETLSRDTDIDDIDLIVDGKRYINCCYQKHNQTFMAWIYSEISGREDFTRCKPTHWMYAPPLPNEEKKNNVDGYYLISPPNLQRDWVGLTVRATKLIRNNGGQSVDAGYIGIITSVAVGKVHLDFEICEICKTKLYVSIQVKGQNCFEFVKKL